MAVLCFCEAESSPHHPLEGQCPVTRPTINLIPDSLHEVIAAALRGGPFEVIQSFRFSPEQAERFLNIMDGIEHDKAKAYEAPDVISQEVPW